MVELFQSHPLMPEGHSRAVLVPVILTTAQIWTTRVDFRDANLADGTLSEDKVEVQERDWVYYQYHQSPALKHSLPHPTDPPREIAPILDRDYIRTIPVVTANGLEKFLRQFDDDMDFLQETR
jgi:hypothetical protein